MVNEILVVELWYDREPFLDHARLLDDVRRWHGDAETTSTSASSPLVIAFPSVTQQFADGVGCLVIGVAEPTVRERPGRPRDLTQTWMWPEAEQVLAGTTHTVVVADVIGHVHAPVPRVAAFRAVVNAIMAQTDPVGTWWPMTVCALPPQLATAQRLGGLVNVRLFNDADRPGHLLMDTVGMHTLGLPDVQIHFHDLPEGRVAGLLFALADSIFSGADIRAGHTVQGLLPDQRWRVSHQQARVEPDRLVLDLDPGPEFNALP